MNAKCTFTAESAQGITRIAIGGQITMADIMPLKGKLQELFGDDLRGVVVDLSGVPLVDSTVIGFMISALKITASHECELALIGLGSTAMETLRITNLLKILPVYPSWDEARRAMEG